MIEIKKGTANPRAKIRPERSRQVKAKEVPIEGKPPSTITVSKTDNIKAVVPGSVWRQGPFKWDPTDFVTESEKLNDRIIDFRLQNVSLLNFKEDPSKPVIYGVAGNPDDSKAKLFAAYLIQLHQSELAGHHNVVWHTMYGGYDNTLMKEYKDVDSKSEPTMLVLSNLTPSSTNVKIEKTKDLIERFSNIPRIIVCAGEDPMSFLHTRLFVPVNAIAYFCEAIVKRRIEVI